MSTSPKAASPEKEQQHKEHAVHHDYSSVLPSLAAVSCGSEVPPARRFLTKETAAIHTMHEARDRLCLPCRISAEQCCGKYTQIVKHFNSTEQGIKNYLHRHVRARKLDCMYAPCDHER